ncbi:phospholipase D-like domain-containing protein [Terriglobus albidus]|uniref:phospholipase D-like domain-containing protein n=1 Tax=Terriglobus albidus TaxID=1592106 RepID=UPI0021DF8CC7|nr:phospholipase D-like domain-containing protein [Terriglobus albidus]
MSTPVKLLVQPDDGIKPLLAAINKAKKNIRILIFRFDRFEIEKALVAAVERGVTVQALIAYTNRGEEKNLRKLEMQLLERGITVSRTANDLVRYHGKMMIVDDKDLYIFAYNYTHMDIDLSRSFGVAIKTVSTVKEAIELFDADAHRVAFKSKSKNSGLVISPVNARERLTDFIRKAKKRLYIYEMKISDAEFIRLLQKKIAEGVEVRVLSRASAKSDILPVRKIAMRLHARVILRDSASAFIGSQSLRKLELEARREVGVIFKDAKVVHQIEEVFDHDWKKSEPIIPENAVEAAFDVPAKKVAKELAKKISVKPVVEKVLDRVMDIREDAPFEPDEVVQTVRDAVRQEVQEAVAEALRNLALDCIGTAPDDPGPEKETASNPKRNSHPKSSSGA